MKPRYFNVLINSSEAKRCYWCFTLVAQSYSVACIKCPLPHCALVLKDSMATPVGFLLQLPRTFYTEAVTLAGGPETSNTPELVRTSTDEEGDPNLVTTSE